MRLVGVMGQGKHYENHALVVFKDKKVLCLRNAFFRPFGRQQTFFDLHIFL